MKQENEMLNDESVYNAILNKLFIHIKLSCCVFYSTHFYECIVEIAKKPTGGLLKTHSVLYSA